MGMYDKQQSSRFLRYQNTPWAGTGTLLTTTFSDQTRQIRVTSQIAGWIAVVNSSSTTVEANLPTTAGLTGAFSGNIANTGEYYAVSPGQVLAFASTSTSSGLIVSVSEMT